MWQLKFKEFPAAKEKCLLSKCKELCSANGLDELGRGGVFPTLPEGDALLPTARLQFSETLNRGLSLLYSEIAAVISGGNFW